MTSITEWNVNHALHTLFVHNPDYMLIFQDPDLHIYVDRHLIPLTQANSPRKISRKAALTRRDRFIGVDPQQLRPDALLLTRNGKPQVVETKLGKINARSECLALIVQTLLYADLIISPRWLSLGRCDNNPPSTTYDLLEDLHEAHWFMKVADEGIYQPIEKRHQKHFRLPKTLNKRDWEKIPDVILLLEDVNRERVQETRSRVRDSSFEDFKEYAEGSLRGASTFKKRLKHLKGNWDKLRQVDFYLMTLDTSKFQSVIGPTITPL